MCSSDLVSLSTVVSKYIGETEQNLEEVFEAASQGDLVLFFDEADALFAKRSEVTDSKDRYANLETSYLLQRLERHDGMVVLATNFQNNIDQAFLRRIDLSIEFLAPERPERLRLWQRSFPPDAPYDGVDLERLAALFDLTGGSIRKAALHAGFLAADASTSITNEVVLAAIRREYQKLGRLLPPS